MANGIHGAVPAGVAHYGRAIELFREQGNRTGLVSSLASRAVYASPALVDASPSALGTLEECARDTDEALRIAREIRSPAGQAYAEWTASANYASFGDLGLALSHGQEALRIATEIEHVQWTCAARFALGQSYTSALAPELAVRELAIGLGPLVRVNGIAPATVIEGSSMFPRDRVMVSLKKYNIEFSEEETTESLRSKLAEFYARRTITRRPILPIDNANAICWLAGEQSAKTTGHVIPVDGGLPEAFLR
jgi:hypothetical protein